MGELPNEDRNLPPDGDDEPRWDADDPRRRDDCFAPPAEPCECYCLHCGRVFMSDQMWFQQVINSKDGFKGFWKCPTPNCDGAGFTFDIFPTDPNHPANDGWHDDDDDEQDDELADEQDDWDPEETRYAELDEELAEDDDIEGDEWKYGLEPGHQSESQMSDEARKEWEEEQRRYDEPDERPRVLDWSDRDTGYGGAISEDDIPF